MAQKLSKFIQKEIVDFTTCLIEIGLETGNNYPKSTTSSGVTYISPAVEDSNHKIIFDTQLEYADFYKKLDEKTNYNVKLVDGSLVSLIYEIDDKDNHILTHRLTFFPSPSLFANEIYEEAGLIDGYEELYSDIISKNIYPFPIRFDFDLDNSVDIEHHVASGLNDNRKQLLSLLSMVQKGEVRRIFILYKDRLTRFGFRYIKQICDFHHVEIVVVSEEEYSKTQSEELAEDIIALIHSFSGKLYGLRKRIKEGIDDRG